MTHKIQVALLFISLLVFHAVAGQVQSRPKPNFRGNRKVLAMQYGSQGNNANQQTGYVAKPIVAKNRAWGKGKNRFRSMFKIRCI